MYCTADPDGAFHAGLRPERVSFFREYLYYLITFVFTEAPTGMLSVVAVPGLSVDTRA